MKIYMDNKENLRKIPEEAKVVTAIKYSDKNGKFHYLLDFVWAKVYEYTAEKKADGVNPATKFTVRVDIQKTTQTKDGYILYEDNKGLFHKIPKNAVLKNVVRYVGTNDKLYYTDKFERATVYTWKAKGKDGKEFDVIIPVEKVIEAKL